MPQLHADNITELTSCSNWAEKFRSFFVINPKVSILPWPEASSMPFSSHASLSELQDLADTEYVDLESDEVVDVDDNANAISWGYLSDLSSEEENIGGAGDDAPDTGYEPVNHPLSTRNFVPPPRPKWRKLDIPVRTAQEQAKQARSQELKDALHDIEKLIASKRTEFTAGANGLQSKCAHSIQSCLYMVVNNNRCITDASECAAESQGFAARWGGRMVKQWVQVWIKSQELPKSNRGHHRKVFSLLDDLEVQIKLHSYMQTNKWSMNPQKLSDFTKNKLLPDEAKKYMHHIIETEMPEV